MKSINQENPYEAPRDTGFSIPPEKQSAKNPKALIVVFFICMIVVNVYALPNVIDSLSFLATKSIEPLVKKAAIFNGLNCVLCTLSLFVERSKYSKRGIVLHIIIFLVCSILACLGHYFYHLARV